jgi:hypothetical protein
MITAICSILDGEARIEMNKDVSGIDIDATVRTRDLVLS